MTAVLALLSSLLWGTSDYLGGTVSRRVPVAGVLGTSQLVALLGLVPVAVLTGELGHDRGYLLPAAAAGLVGVGALAAFYRALAAGTMGVVAPSAVGFGVVIALVAAGSRGKGGSVVMTLLTMRLASVLLLTAVLLATVRRRGWDVGVRRPDLPLLTAIGAGDVLANGTFAIASQSGLVSVTSVLASLYPVVTALLAYRFHGERLRPVQLVGMVAALAGVVLLAGG